MEWRGSVRRSPQLFNLVWPWAQPNTEAPPPPHTLRVSACQLLYWRKRGRHCGTDLAWCWSLGERREGGRQGGTFVLESLTGRENLCERRVCVKREGGRGGSPYVSVRPATVGQVIGLCSDVNHHTFCSEQWSQTHHCHHHWSGTEKNTDFCLF